MLVEGLPVTTVDSDGAPLLHIAAWMVHTEMAEALLDSGADVNARDHYGRTAIGVLRTWPDPDPEAIRIIEEAGGK